MNRALAWASTKTGSSHSGVEGLSLRKARIALVGTGWWATECHLPALQAHPAARIAALCDLDAAKLQKAADVLNVEQTYADLDTMLANETLDGVMVATHHAAHYAVARSCLERGLHVYIEKPMTLYATDARKLVELARNQRREIVMGYNLNHSESVIRARDIVRSGELGAVQFISGLFSQSIYDLLSGNVTDFQAKVHSPGAVYSDPLRSGGGFGHLQITHLAALICFISGLRISRVQSLMAKHGLRVDLVTAILAEFEGGALATLGGTGNLPGGGRSCSLTIYCERGWLTLDDEVGSLTIRRPGRAPEERVRNTESASAYPYFAPTHNFVDLILSQGENLCGGNIGWHATEFMDAAYRSAARDGAAVARRELYGERTE